MTFRFEVSHLFWNVENEHFVKSVSFSTDASSFELLFRVWPLLLFGFFHEVN